MQEIGVKLGTNSDGALQFTVTDTMEEAQTAAWALQVLSIDSHKHHLVLMLCRATRPKAIYACWAILGRLQYGAMLLLFAGKLSRLR